MWDGGDTGCQSGLKPWHGGPIETARLTLRGFAEGDVPVLADLANDEAVARATATMPYPYTVEHAQAFISDSEGATARFAIVLRDDQALVGAIELRVDGEGAELGYWVGRPFWGQGLATEAVLAVQRLAFESFGVARVWGEALLSNPASRKVLEKAGLVFSHEGVCSRGRSQGLPSKFYALSREDWKAHEAAKPTLVVVAAALVDAEGRVLLQQRPKGKAMGGLWEFPGGKVEQGETPETALVRELREELAIDLSESCLAPLTFASHAYEHFHLLMPLYVARQWRGQVQALEGQTLKWARPVEMFKLPMPPADIPLIPLLQDWV